MNKLGTVFIHYVIRTRKELNKMKILVLMLSLITLSLQDKTVKDIETIMQAGNSKELIALCNKTVKIKINGKSSNYSKAQAEVILKDFFNKNVPKTFTYIHQGASQDGLKYTIGRYTHANGVYRVVMLVKKIENKYLIDTLSFSQE